MIHDSDWCKGERRDDRLDEVRCACGHLHYRCARCGGIVDGLHDEVSRWSGGVMPYDPYRMTGEEE
jgi:hypothetical protein